MRREFLMLAQKYDPKIDISGWYMSEKLDGMRAFWDGGISRGALASDVPWANTEKHARYKKEQRATGLWTRYGQPIHAPDKWLGQLPEGLLLDGELWMGRGNFQKVTSCVKKLEPDDDWESVQFLVFDIPSLASVFSDGEIKNANMELTIDRQTCLDWCLERKADLGWGTRHWLWLTQYAVDFVDTQKRFDKVQWNDTCRVLPQKRLPAGAAALDILNETLLDIESLGGEGVMLRRPISKWQPKRVRDLLKVKSAHDMEVTVVGYTWGRETDKGSKLLGLMGALRCRLDNGKELLLSGFTDSERVMLEKESDKMIGHNAIKEGELNPGKEVSDNFESLHFKRGSKVTIRYRELTDDGIPKEARYWRKA